MFFICIEMIHFQIYTNHFFMLRFFIHSVPDVSTRMIRSFGTSFDALLREHKNLATNLQKIAEADRKFVSFEVCSWFP